MDCTGMMILRRRGVPNKFCKASRALNMEFIPFESQLLIFQSCTFPSLFSSGPFDPALFHSALVPFALFHPALYYFSSPALFILAFSILAFFILAFFILAFCLLPFSSCPFPSCPFRSAFYIWHELLCALKRDTSCRPLFTRGIRVGSMRPA